MIQQANKNTFSESRILISPIKVCRNGRGKFYIGRTMDEGDGWETPYDRLSQEYYNDEEQAQKALDSRDFTPRYYEMDDITRKMVFSFMSEKA